jgi:membrane dipeptidase
MSTEITRTLHERSIVIDAVCPLLMDDASYLDWYRQGGVTIAGPTVGGWEGALPTLRRIGRWHRLLRERPDVILVKAASDIERAKRAGALGVFWHLQGTDPVETELDFVDLYRALGVGMVQLTYNVRNRIGDGCEERTDAGLSRFGIKLIERLNAARVIVDCSHTGLRTSLEAIELSSAPVVLSHSNLDSIHPSPRNVCDELLHAIADSGGLIGIAGFPAMVSTSPAPSVDELIAHIEGVVQRAGIDHVGLGIDYYWGQAGVASDAAALAAYDEAVRDGRWSAAYPAPPHHYPAGIETPRTLPNLTVQLLERGFSERDTQKILGGNWLRVMREVWG